MDIVVAIFMCVAYSFCTPKICANTQNLRNLATYERMFFRRRHTPNASQQATKLKVKETERERENVYTICVLVTGYASVHHLISRKFNKDP